MVNPSNVIVDPRAQFFTPTGLETGALAQGNLGMALGFGAQRRRALREFLPQLQANNAARTKLAGLDRGAGVFKTLMTQPAISINPEATSTLQAGAAKFGGLNIGGDPSQLNATNAATLPANLLKTVLQGQNEAGKAGFAPPANAPLDPQALLKGDLSGLPGTKFQPGRTAGVARGAASATTTASVQGQRMVEISPGKWELRTIKGSTKSPSPTGAAKQASTALQELRRQLAAKGASKEVVASVRMVTHQGRLVGKVPIPGKPGTSVLIEPLTGKRIATVKD